MAIKTAPTLGGLPIEEWVGRRVIWHGAKKEVGTRPLNSQLVELSGNLKRAVIKPMNSRSLRTVPISELKPLWSKSPDLHQKAKELDADSERPRMTQVISKKAQTKADPEQEEPTPVANKEVETLARQLQATQEQLDGLLSKRINFTVGDMLEHKDSILGNLGVLASKASELKNRRDKLQEEIELADVASSEMQDALDKLGGWIEG